VATKLALDSMNDSSDCLVAQEVDKSPEGTFWSVDYHVETASKMGCQGIGPWFSPEAPLDPCVTHGPVCNQ
jgi:hypothetical protein